jgi:hypothetical protein
VGSISCCPCTFHEVITVSGRILAAFRSRLIASSPTTIYRSPFCYSSPTYGSGLLAVDDAVVRSTWRAGAVTIWNTFVDDTASTYFHATHGKTRLCKTRLHMYTLLFHIPNTLIYMSFSTQHHNTTAEQDMTSSTLSEPNGRIRRNDGAT